MKVAVRSWKDGIGNTGKHCCWWCVGCAEHHIWQIEATKGPNWEWDGDTEKPTVSPSILTRGSRPDKRCHVFIKAGQIKYLNDCGHKLAGQTVAMVDLPDWFVKK